jgi:hypothetical protein
MLILNCRVESQKTADTWVRPTYTKPVQFSEIILLFIKSKIMTVGARDRSRLQRRCSPEDNIRFLASSTQSVRREKLDFQQASTQSVHEKMRFSAACIKHTGRTNHSYTEEIHDCRGEPMCSPEKHEVFSRLQRRVFARITRINIIYTEAYIHDS